MPRGDFMETIYTRIKLLREQLDISQQELANMVGYNSRSSIAKIEKGEVDLPQSKIESFAKALNTTQEYLLGIQSEKNLSINNYMSIPLYGDISCGTGLFVDDQIKEYIPLPNDGLNPNYEYFAQYASGSSMLNAGINDGDILIFQKSTTIDDGKIGCFTIDEDIATCKKIKYGTNYIQLIPMNPNYDPIVIDPHSQEFRTIGILKRVIKKID